MLGNGTPDCTLPKRSQNNSPKNADDSKPDKRSKCCLRPKCTLKRCLSKNPAYLTENLKNLSRQIDIGRKEAEGYKQFN
ncbi:hypothetical protein Ddc_05693 [Ditylenchus destructor]|nr:hypothetical protein Ddc_05693 [Ditylenchus destructor]